MYNGSVHSFLSGILSTSRVVYDATYFHTN